MATSKQVLWWWTMDLYSCKETLQGKRGVHKYTLPAALLNLEPSHVADSPGSLGFVVFCLHTLLIRT
eukprot:SAG31_NODE_436_length_15717_cov_5.420412_13_plen_67_part_00